MLGPEDLVLCAGTGPRAPFAERAAAAAAAGFAGISVFVDDFEAARAKGLSEADLRAILADHGLRVAEVDPLLRWLPGSEPATGTATGSGVSAEGVGFFRYGEDDFYRVADALGARSLNAVVYTDEPVETDSLVESFAGLCDRAAGHDLLVHLEFLPWTPVADAFAALAIAEAAGRRNGGIMLDTWHHFRGAVPDERLCELPGERVLAVQLSDAPAATEANPVEETLRRRLLPGEGDIDLPSLLRILREIGSPAPLGVEVFSDTLAALPMDEAARRAADTTRAALGLARTD
ncbi:MAG: TIM barrel protein [Proteobacteria bacterium]|nr:TIM barrel protein [Pseudomonadota bacterium]